MKSITMRLGLGFEDHMIWIWVKTNVMPWLLSIPPNYTTDQVATPNLFSKVWTTFKGLLSNYHIMLHLFESAVKKLVLNELIFLQY